MVMNVLKKKELGIVIKFYIFSVKMFFRIIDLDLLNIIGIFMDYFSLFPNNLISGYGNILVQR